MKSIFSYSLISSIILLLSCQSSEPNSNKNISSSKQLSINQPETSAYLQDLGYYSQDTLVEDTFEKGLRDRTVEPGTGERVNYSATMIDSLLDNIIDYKNYGMLFANSRIAGQYRKKITTSVSFSFGIDELNGLVEDIKKSGLPITGVRVQLYEKISDDTNKNVIDALIVAVNKNGEVIASTQKDGQTKSFVLNVSNPCPDECDGSK